MTLNDYTYILILNGYGNTKFDFNEEPPIEKDLKGQLKELNITINDVNKIIKLLTHIFNHDNLHIEINSKNSIINPIKFNLYFRYLLDKNLISEQEFNNSRINGTLDTDIKKWIKNGLEIDLISKLLLVKHFDSNQDFKLIIKTIFNLVRHQSILENRLIYYPHKDLLNKFIYFKDILLNNDKSKHLSYHSFLNQLFDSAKSPFTYESSFINYVIKNDPSFPLTKEKLQKKLINYLNHYSSKTNKFDYVIWDLYKKCIISTSIIPGIYDILPEAKSIMQEFIFNKDLDGYIWTILNISIHNDGNTAIDVDSVKEIFGSWDTFFTQLVKVDEANYKFVKEFKQFIRTLENDEASKIGTYIKYSFSDIPIQKRSENLILPNELRKN